MLTLTDNASDIIKSITEQNTDADGAGVRFSRDGDRGIAITASDAPLPGDEVVEYHGARVFLEEGASAVLSDKILDAAVDPAGSIQFSVAPQA